MSIIDDILSKVDIVDIIGEYVDLKKSGSNYKALCPFHNEKTPSFIVSENKQIFKCFGCGKGGNALTFIKEIENVDFYEAIKILAKKANIDLKNYSFKINQEDFDLKNRLIQLNKTALNFFHKKLFEDEKAFSYLTNKRKLNKDIIIKYKLGFSGTNSNEFINYLKNKGFKENEILKAGLAKKTSSGALYSFFTNRIIFPIFSSIGEPIAFSGRIFNQEQNTGKYINTPETILYNKSGILYNFNNAKKTKHDFLIVCEGYMDVIGADRLGYDNAVATCGTALTEKHILMLKRVTKNIIFAFDSDNAGFQANLRGLKIALSLGIYPLIYNINGGKDFDELANLGEKVNIKENSKDGITYFMDYFLQDYTNLTIIERQEKVEQIFDILKKIGNFNIFWDYLEKLGKKINKDPNILYQQIKIKKQSKKISTTENKQKNEYMIPSLLYNNFYKKFTLNKNIDELVEKTIQILDYIDDNNILKQIFLSPKNEDILKENQLLWEEKLLSLHQKKIDQILENEIKKYLIGSLTEIIKNPKTKNKLEIIKVLNEIRK